MINLLAPLNNTTGYGITSTNIWKQLNKLTDTYIFPIGGISLETEDDQEIAQKAIERTLTGESKDAPCLKIWHMHDLFSRVGSGKYGVFPFFEIDKLKPIELACLKHADIIFATCEWAKQIYVDNGISADKIVIAPLAADHSVFNPDITLPQMNTPYKFINIGKWEIRKSHDLLVHIFNEAFTEKDNVELHMVNHNPFLKPEQAQAWKDLYKNSKLGDKIFIHDRIPTHKQLAGLISEMSCGVYISRAEGWNNEILETMAMNKPVIATNYSAHTAYCNKDNSFLVDIDDLESAVDNMWFDGFGKWAKIGAKQVEQIIEHMRHVYSNDIRVNPNGVNTSQSFTWENTAKTIIKYLL